MADQRHRNPKSKSFDTFRDEEAKKSKNRKKHHQKYESKIKEHHSDSRTPPLPTGISSIEELIRQRNSLKDELSKMTKSFDGTKKYCSSKNIIKRSKHLDDCKLVKRHRSEYSEAPKSPNDLKVPEDSSPYDDNSEDEENIIEVRRKQRQQLLEKLQLTQNDNEGEKKPQIIINTSHQYTKDKNVGSSPIQHEETKQAEKYSTDIFAEIDDFTPKSVPDGVIRDNNNDNPQLTDNWDDPEGYYNIRIGDTLNKKRYTIKDTLGQGVFANVVRAQDNNNLHTDVAIKITRNNDLMLKTAIKEISYLKEINDADPEDRHHCVKFLGSFIHKGHLCLVLEPLHMDMRTVIKKYGRHGLNLSALISYSRQLLLALRHLKKVGIIHADIKPDNMLVNQKKNVLKLCDFGSAGKVLENEPTPYLVSRFYRAPEIILGVTYSHEVDLWSAACTIYEMAVGKILFTGSSNNKMLKCFMDVKGKMSNRLIRSGKFKDQHFNYNYNFLIHKKDDITGRDKVVELVNIKVTRNLLAELKKSITNEKKLTQLKDLLDKMLILDPSLRLSVTDALKHAFIREEYEKSSKVQ